MPAQVAFDDMICHLEREEPLDVTQLGICQPFDAVPCPGELRKCDLGKAPVGWVGNCSETVIILWFQVKIPQALEQQFLLCMVLVSVFRNSLDVEREYAY